MAVWTFNRSVLEDGVDIMSSRIFEGLLYYNVLQANSTVFRVRDPEFDDVFTFTGQGLTYSTSNGQTAITGGTLTSLNVVFEGLTIGSWTGFSISAAAASSGLAAGNWSALNTLIFGTNDTFNLTNFADEVRGFGGNDRINGFGGADRLYGDGGNDTLVGGSGSDILRGGTGADRLLGEGGNDKLFGDTGADVLLGGTGRDTLIGGTGIDTLTGGAGADVFAFNHTGATNREIITDFLAVDDALHFNNDVFTAFNYVGGLRPADFVRGTNALDAADRFIYQQSTGNLWYDRDGSGSATKVLVAELRDGTTLSATDIFIL
ncbi:calcium-binding protein [Tabrizicola sp.]|uniref:calcium-binding protein n=1 Tax=Tabrizicola sp. TaxID=2005166 RepID=UPI003D2B42CF